MRLISAPSQGQKQTFARQRMSSMKTKLFATVISLSLTPLALAKDVTRLIDTTRSTVQWTGSKVVGGSHTGKVRIKEGSAVLADGKVKSAKVDVDMTSLIDEDLKDKSDNDELV